MGVSLGIVSTYPATQCGIATFCESLVTYLVRAGADVGVVRVVDQPGPTTAPVVHHWVAPEAGGAARAAGVLDGFDAVLVQHEYGIFPGDDGEAIVDVVARLHVPVITVLHTVLTSPTANQHRVLAGLVRHSAALVTMTETARDRLLAGWDVDPARVSVIPHGAVENRSHTPGAWTSVAPERRTVLTWGLLSEGKGIEWALLGLAELRERMALPTYVVLGQTHPRVREREGEVYRDGLQRIVRDLELTETVRFDDRYLAGPDLRRAVRAADVVLLPYDSREQVTSGVLTEAVAAGKPVVSTAFPHAVELLSGGAGILVARRDPSAIANALERVLGVDGVAERMAAASRDLAGTLLWPTVAERYVALAAGLCAADRGFAGQHGARLRPAV